MNLFQRLTAHYWSHGYDWPVNPLHRLINERYRQAQL